VEISRKSESNISRKSESNISRKSESNISRKSESNISRKSRSIEHGDGDKLPKSSSLSKIQSNKNTNKQSIGSVQAKNTKQSLASKSNSINASSSHVIKKSINSKTKSESITKLDDDSMIKKRKSREQVGHLEEKALSTIYQMPKSNASKLKANEKIVHRMSNDKEKQDFSIPNRTKPRVSSRERRKSRTLSPSEIKMLHNAMNKPDITETIEQKKNVPRNDHQNAQADLNDADYDYEDDFEVEKINQQKKS